jgi:hypothetical protein
VTAPLSTAQRLARDLERKKHRRLVLDREIAALEELARLYLETREVVWRQGHLDVEEGV